MSETSNQKAIAVAFAKEESGGFSRCSFPLLGRPTLVYPLLAASNSSHISAVFLSTPSPMLAVLAKHVPNTQVVTREAGHDTFLEELEFSIDRITQELDERPAFCVILFGNSPCILPETIDNAISLIAQNPDMDSVVTAYRRREFCVNQSLMLTDKGMLSRRKYIEDDPYEYFIDSRLIVTRTDALLRLSETHRGFNEILGDRICPIFINDGMSDIDYAWQVPHVERWLKANGFTDRATPYGKETIVVQPVGRIDEGGHEKKNILITTVPFGEVDPYPVNILEAEPKCEYTINPIGRKLKEDELAELIVDFDVVIAGTEPITEKVMKGAKKLQLVSRVGIGLDSVDLNAARELGIHVSYTPDAPSAAVAELTIGHMLNIDRRISHVDRHLRDGVWQRIMGERLANQVIGIIGVGRVGSRVLKHLQGFSPKRTLVNDLFPNTQLYDLYGAEHVTKEAIYKECDIITLHVPLTMETLDLVGGEELNMMKPSAAIINTSRGGIVNERQLFHALSSRRIAAAGIDTFESEPYGGPLKTLDNCFFTCHMGSCSKDCRFEMERLATEEALRFVRGEELQLTAPEDEYVMQSRREGK